MESFYGKQTSKDKSLKENDNKKTHNVEKNGTKIIHGQIISTTDCRRKNFQAKKKSNDKKIQKDSSNSTDVHGIRGKVVNQ